MDNRMVRMGMVCIGFMDRGKKAIVLEKGLKAATITGCLLRGKDGIVNESEGDVQVGMNTTQ